MLNPDQLFIGNYNAKISPSRPLIFEQSAQHKTSIRFYLEGNMLVGYQSCDFGVALTQIEHISLKDEEQENPAALTFAFKSTCMEKVWRSLTGLKPIAEKPYRENKALARNMTFILKTFENEPDKYLKVTYGSLEEGFSEHYFDFEVAKSLMLNDIHAVWRQMISEQWRRRPSISKGHTHHLVSQMDNCAWVQWLADQKLMKSTCARGTVQYIKVDDNPLGRRALKANKSEHTAAKKTSFVKSQKKYEENGHRKIRTATRVYGKLVRNDREVYAMVVGPRAPREDFFEFEPTFTAEIRAMGFLPKTKKKRPNGEKMSTEDNDRPSLLATPSSNGSSNYVYEAYRNSVDFGQPEKQNLGHGDHRYVDYRNHYQQNGYANGYGYPWTPSVSRQIDMTSSGAATYFLRQQGDYAPSQHIQGPGQKIQYVSAKSPATPEAVPPVEERLTAESQLFSFPPKDLAIPGIDPVVVLMKDVRTLDRKEFVNDNMISFMLNYIAVYMIDKDLFDTIHLCNTFFYVNLTRTLPPLCFSLRKPIASVHEQKLVENCIRVLRWTKKFDVFAKDYIVIPINEDFHWLLVTVFNPSGAIVDLENQQESRAAPKCYIAFFDPLSGLDPVKRNHMCHCIKIYLQELYENTKTEGKRFCNGRATTFDPDRVVIMRPKNLPIQDNFFDCGLYALHFIEGLFCYLKKPVTVKDFPDFDWSTRYPSANGMAELMRDKIYNLVLHEAGKKGRERLSRFERSMRCGLGQEGELRRSRRHSAADLRRLPRHREFRARHYSVNPTSHAVMDDPMFNNPREMAEMPITSKVRAMKWPEENFPVIY
ncbi:unnamed protein product [Caenorhabditis sp. 36 PRJEB53466]|nr:unnamed protein product [Caenorhabditis sp. 36 PRJEB53466]